MGTASNDYIQLYKGNASLLAESLEVVQHTASTILRALHPQAGALKGVPAFAFTLDSSQGLVSSHCADPPCIPSPSGLAFTQIPEVSCGVVLKRFGLKRSSGFC